jgi:hypothetical protein
MKAVFHTSKSVHNKKIKTINRKVYYRKIIFLQRAQDLSKAPAKVSCQRQRWRNRNTGGCIMMIYVKRCESFAYELELTSCPNMNNKYEITFSNYILLLKHTVQFIINFFPYKEMEEK